MRESTRQRREAEVVAQIARSINASLDLDSILQTVANGARELCESDLSAIALREEGSGEMVFRYRAGQRYREGGRLVVVPGRGAGGQVLVTGRPFRSDNLLEDPRVNVDPPSVAAAEEKIVTVMVVPIRIGDRLEGLLYVDNRSPRGFTDHDEAILLQLADHAGVAIRNAQLLLREQQARADAETANRTKDEFLATLSHELRTPLNAVLGWAVTLRSGVLDAATAARALEAIERNARVQGQLIEDLLDISRIVTGKLRVDVRLVDLVTVVEAALDAVRPGAEAKGVRLQPMLDPRAGPISGDPDRLQQIVWNLLSNAIKFTPRDGRVHVRLERASSHVEIIVSDSGAGIPPEVLPYVFDRFRQADSTTTRSQRGLGIGLSLVKHLVELHGGSVHAASPGPGHGSTFTVKLPLLVRFGAREADRVHPTAGRSVPVTTTAVLTGVRTLVVDDAPDALELLEGMLTMRGAEVRGAASVAEALAILAEWRADVIVSDIEMPGEDGYALIRKLRARGRDAGGETPAVAVTAYGSVADRIRILSAGFNMHVPKPVEPAELIAVLANLVGRLDPR